MADSDASGLRAGIGSLRAADKCEVLTVDSKLDAATQQHIDNLVDLATRAGQPDAYEGKRAQVRYRIKMPIEVRTLEPNAECYAGELHDVSSGGIGLWTERAWVPGTEIMLREWQPHGHANWVPATIMHCTRGLTGYLIGAAFPERQSVSRPTTTPTAASAGGDAGAKAAPAAAAAKRAEKKKPARRRIHTLRDKAIQSAVLSGLPTALLVGCSAFTGWIPLESALMASAGAAMTGAVASLIVWWRLRPDARYLGAVADGMDALLQTGQAPEAPRPGCCGEILEIDASIQRLRGAMERHEEAAQQQRRRAEALDQVESGLLNAIAHDLRTPLTSILLYSELMRSELEQLDAAEQQHCLGIIAIETQRLTKLIDNLTRAQRVSAGEVPLESGQIDPGALAAECVGDFQPLAMAKNIELALVCEPDLPVFESDKQQLTQIVSNLLSNAIKFTPAGGRVQVDVEAYPAEVIFRVSDNGPGIEREQWDRIFQRFTQVRPSLTGESAGVGIGLYLVRQLATRLGGRVWLDSTPGRGSEFSVAIPRTPTAATRDPLYAGRRVLVCDYDPELAARIAQLLQDRGFEVDLAHSAVRLLEQISQHNYDVVLTDVLLHDLPTEEVLSKLTAPERRYRLVVHTHATQAAELRRRGVDIVLGRPAEKSELQDAVQLAVGLKPHCATVLLVCPAGHALSACGEQLARDGHLSVIVNDCREAASQAESYPFDRVLVAEELLDEDWSELAPLLAHQAFPDTVLVVTATATRQARLNAERMGVASMPLRSLQDPQSVVTGRAGARVALVGSA
jgi:signal transduction histidine kinase/DNA-binding response OmpR family regulator